jgi:translation initiation factor IF-1
MSKKNPLEVEGRVVEPLPNGMYSVVLENGQKVTAHIASAARLSFIRVIPGDKVLLELSPFDHTRGRITHRFK